MMMRCDLVIQGGGFAGLTLALLAAKAGKSVIVIDQQSIPARTDAARDIRTVAISAGSRAILEQAGAWRTDRFPQCPITHIDILDGDGPTVFLGFDAIEAGSDAFGHIVDNIDLRRALIEEVAGNSAITHLMEDTLTDWMVHDDHVTATTQNGQSITAQLLVGADGRQSAIRQEAHIPQFGWAYKESAVVVTIGHEHPHRNIAIERFRDTGPFAVLPMVDHDDGTHRSAIVWTLKEGDARLQNPPQDTIQSLLPDFYGAVTWMGRVQSYPLSLQHSYAYTAPRVALIADAAHVIHPIAGQGLNVGLRDVADLASLLPTDHDCGSADMLKSYERMRRGDVTAMVVFTDQLNRLFVSGLAPVRWVRRLGMRAIAKTPALRQFFMKRAMGY